MDEYFVAIQKGKNRKQLLEKTLNMIKDKIPEQYGNKYDYIFQDKLNKLVEIGMVSENNGIYKLTKEGYKYRDIIS